MAKYAADGLHVWSKRFGGTLRNRGQAVAMDAVGNVVVTGLFEGTVEFGGVPLTSAGVSDIFLIRLRK